MGFGAGVAGCSSCPQSAQGVGDVAVQHGCHSGCRFPRLTSTAPTRARGGWSRSVEAVGALMAQTKCSIKLHECHLVQVGSACRTLEDGTHTVDSGSKRAVIEP